MEVQCRFGVFVESPGREVLMGDLKSLREDIDVDHNGEPHTTPGGARTVEE